MFSKMYTTFKDEYIFVNNDAVKEDMAHSARTSYAQPYVSNIKSPDMYIVL